MGTLMLTMFALGLLVALAAMTYGASKYRKLNKDYRAADILRDLKSGRIRRPDLDEALKVAKILSNLKRFRLNIDDLAWLNEMRLRRATDFHNNYTRGEYIPLDFFLTAIKGAIRAQRPDALLRIRTARSVGTFIRDLVDKN